MSTKDTLPTMNEDATRKLLIELVNAGFDCGAYPEENMLKSDAYEKLSAKSRQLTDKIHALITSLHTRLDAAEKGLAGLKDLKPYVQQQASTADANSHGWQLDQASGITDINAAYCAGMWYAYRDVVNRLP